MKRILLAFKEKWPYYFLEVIVIACGILLAFGLNNWNEGRKQKLLEIELLKDLVEVTKRNNEDVLETGIIESEIHNSMKILKYVVENDLPFSDSLSQHLDLIEDSGLLFVDYSAYETIKKYGQKTITNDSLRLRIGNAYGQLMAELIKHQDWREKKVISLLNWSWFKGNNPVIPFDFEALKKGPQFTYLLEFQLQQTALFKCQWRPPGIWAPFIIALEAEIARLEGQ